MSEFQREERYIVVKLKHLAGLQQAPLRNFLRENRVPQIECVVVEHDWPEYHLVWAMLEHRMAGKPVPDFNLWRRADELQQRLNAADQRVDVLEGLLRRSQDFVAFVHKCVRRNGEYAPLHRQEMDELNRDLSDYVEPGVPVCEQCRGEGRVGGPAPDEGGGKNCPACDGTGVIEPANEAALKPAEVGADSCEFCKGWGFLANQDGADEGCGACNGTGKEPAEGGGDE